MVRMTAQHPPELASASWRSLAISLVLGVVLAALGGGAIFWITRPDSGRNAKVENPDDPPKEDPGTKPSGPPWFRDVTADSGLHFTHRNGEEADQYTILESVGGGV